MKRILVTALAAVVLGACAERGSTVTDPGPQFELVDQTIRVDAGKVNAWVYGTFVLDFPGTAARVITSGPANFPGNPPSPGYCVDGMWYNPKHKPTSGSMDRPHPHCVILGTEDVQVVLEPISVYFGNAGNSCNEFLRFTNDESAQVKYVGAGGQTCTRGNPHTEGEGTIVAYAVNLATGDRVGTLTIDLTQYAKTAGNLFAQDCSMDGENLYRCLNAIVGATYTPLASGGVGTLTENVPGQLWWAAATAPYKYDP